MQRSAALQDEVKKLYQAFSQGDADLMTEMTTARDGLVFIGTDPTEWFEDVPSIRRLLEAQAGAGIEVEHGDAVALEEGTVGWLADRGNFVMPDGTKVPFRLTAVFHSENGNWKLVQAHTSVATTNEDSLGVNL